MDSVQTIRTAFFSPLPVGELASPLRRVALFLSAKAILEYAHHHFFGFLVDPSLSSGRFYQVNRRLYYAYYDRMVKAPVYEEVIFRLAILKSVECGQKALKSHLPSWAQGRTFRVHLTTAAFALAHFYTGFEPSWQANAIRFSSVYLGGYIYAHLTEKYESLFPAILAHGVNNALTLLPLSHSQACACLIASRIVSYLLT